MVDKYFGTKIGKLRIPIKMFAQSPEYKGFGMEDIEMVWDPESLELPEELKSHRESWVKKKSEEAKEQGIRFYNSSMVKLAGLEQESRKLRMKGKLTDYHTFKATNCSLEERLADGRTMREKYVSDPNGWDDVLADPVGVSVLVISEPDKKMVYVKRSKKVGMFREVYHDLAAGGMDPDKDKIEGKPHPFLTAKRETKEETGIEFEPEEYRLLGVGRDKLYMHAEVLGELRTDMTVKEILEAPKEDAFELDSIFEVEFTPEKTVPLLKGYKKRADDYSIEGWVPAGAVNVIYSLMKEYGEEGVLKEIEKL